MGGDTEEARIDMAQKLQSTFGIWSKSINHLDFPQQFNHHPSQIHSHKGQISPNSNNESGKRPPSHPQFPPISPYSHNGTANQPLHSQNYNNAGPTHSRSLSQPSFLSLDSLPPLPYKDSPSNDVSMDDRTGYSHSLLPPSGAENTNSLPSRKVHRRSNSDIPFGFSSMLNSSPPVIPFRRVDSLDHKSGAMPIQLVRQDSSEGETVDDLFNACMNMDSFDSLNSSDNHEDFGSRASGTKTTDSSDNEATSSVNQTVNNLQLPGNKRNAWGGDIAPTTTRHYRSISVDSFMGKINFDDESVKLPPSPGICPGQLSPSNSLDKDSGFSLEFGNGEFSGAELKKIMANDKLSEIASADPKRAKRILANRQSAARSKERKMRYIAELEHKVQTLQTEATTLSAQLTLLQRDSVGLSSQNNELKYRVQAMGQQAQLRDALNEALTAEVQRLKITAAEMSGGDASQFQQLSLDRHMYLQNGNTSTKQEMNH